MTLLKIFMEVEKFCFYHIKILAEVKKIFTHIDCFSGPGGICTGFHAAGIQTILAIEKIKSCVDTYAANHSEVKIIHDDIRNVSAEKILKIIPANGVDIVSSGMPCETFSTAGNTSRSFYDDRQFLFREGIRIAKISDAKLILFENVPAITSKTVAKDSKKLIVDVLEKELEDAGYIFHKRFLLNAIDYGVPQRRKRFFILAAKNPEIFLSAPEPVENFFVNVEEAFAGLPDIQVNSKIEEKFYTEDESEFSNLMRDNNFWKLGEGKNLQLSYQTPMNHRQATLERFKLLNPGESLKTLFERYDGEERKILQEKKILPKKMFIKRNYRLKLNEPSPTVTSHCLDEFVHPTKNRALTVRECARLQSFPDCYNFAGGPFIVPHIEKNIQDKYEQIGDAVPPLMAYAWGKKIISILKGENYADENSRILQLDL